MSNYVAEMNDLAQKHEKAALDLIERGKRDGFDPTAAAIEEANIARILRAAAREMQHMTPDAQQDYAHRMKFALWQRLDDSPEVYADREDPL